RKGDGDRGSERLHASLLVYPRRKNGRGESSSDPHPPRGPPNRRATGGFLDPLVLPDGPPRRNLAGCVAAASSARPSGASRPSTLPLREIVAKAVMIVSRIASYTAIRLRMSPDRAPRVRSKQDGRRGVSAAFTVIRIRTSDPPLGSARSLR